VTAHAKLSPSASGRWLECPASVRLLRDIDTHVSSPAAQEGTDFHLLCEITARYRLLGGDEAEYQEALLDWAMETVPEGIADQLMYLEQWIDYLEECLAEEEGAQLFLEQKLQTGIPGCWGTSDTVIIYSDRIKIVDIKYGKGMQVVAWDNPQLMLYGLGALSLVDGNIQVRDVELVAWQPRRDNVSEYHISRKDLEAWREQIRPIAELALTEDAPFGPSEDACYWCPVAGTCKARAEKMLALDFGDPDLLSPAELAEAYSMVKEISRWTAAVSAAALDAANDKKLPGYKVVLSGGRRSIPDSAKAIKVLVDEGFDREAVARESIQTLGVLDKLAGSGDRLKLILGDLLVKGEGSPSLAPESDPRQPADALTTAKGDFADIPNGDPS